MNTLSAMSPAENDRLDRLFHALADRTRRALMARLAQGPRTISELAAPFAMSLPAVSKHIRVLEQGGLVSRAVDGRLHRCSLSGQALRDADQWLSRYRAFWEDSLDALARHVEDAPPEPSPKENHDDATQPAARRPRP